MSNLAGPFEIFELEDGQTMDVKGINFEIGEMLIHPYYQPQGKWITGMRIFTSPGSKEFFPFYWDLTGQTLIAQLRPIFESGNYKTKTFRITKHGQGAKARFSVDVIT